MNDRTAGGRCKKKPKVLIDQNINTSENIIIIVCDEAAAAEGHRCSNFTHVLQREKTGNNRSDLCVINNHHRKINNYPKICTLAKQLELQGLRACTWMQQQPEQKQAEACVKTWVLQRQNPNSIKRRVGWCDPDVQERWDEEEESERWTRH